MNKYNSILLVTLMFLTFSQSHANQPTLLSMIMNDARLTSSLVEISIENGDDLSIPRDVDFYFIAEDMDTAKTVAGFIEDFNYGKATIRKREDRKFDIKVVISTPINQNIIGPISSFMVVVASAFGADYDGFGSMSPKTK